MKVLHLDLSEIAKSSLTAAFGQSPALRSSILAPFTLLLFSMGEQAFTYVYDHLIYAFKHFTSKLRA